MTDLAAFLTLNRVGSEVCFDAPVAMGELYSFAICAFKLSSLRDVTRWQEPQSNRLSWDL